MLYIFLFFFVHFVFFFVYSMFKFRNPYRLHLVIGKKGAGKTTYLSRVGQSAIRSGVNVYSNFRLSGATYFDTSIIDSGQYSFDPGSVILIDEAGTVWDSRNYSKFSPHTRDFFKYQRKLGLTVYLASQTSDVDVKIRILCDDLLVFRPIFNVFSFGRYYLNRICIVHPSADCEARITDDLVPVPLWSFLVGGRPGRLMFLPRWVSVFDTKERL